MEKKKQSDWAKIEKSRERRLWITQVLVPTIGTGIVVWSNPGAREFLKTKFDAVKDCFKYRIKIEKKEDI